MSMNQLVELTGLNDRTVRKRLKPLNPVREDGRSKFFDTREALKLLYPTVASELAEENLLFERAKREKAEIEVKQLRGEVVSVADVVKTISREFAYFRAQFRSIPAKLAKPLSLMSDANECHTRLAEAVDECLSELQADAKFRIEQDRLESLRPVNSESDSDGDEASSSAEPSSVG